jgi:hypothetical protein
MEIKSTSRASLGERRLIMSFSIYCPCGCGEILDAHDEGFSACTVTVPACSLRREAGVISVEIRKSQGYALAVPQAAGWTHRDGLVTLTG